MPIILLFCIVGAFAINNTVFGVGIILVLGLLAYVMEENGFPIAPAVLGIVLGPLVEENFMTSMIKADGSLLGFFSRPIAAVLGAITLLIWAWEIVGWLLRVRRGRKAVPGAETAG
jgi:TctA family transporter